MCSSDLFPSHDNPFDGTVPPATNQTLLIYITGATPGQSWYVEIITYWESIGNRQNPTPSHADPNGMAAINSALAQTGVSNQPPEAQLAAMETKAKAELAQQSGILNFLADGASTLASSAAGFLGGPVAETLVDVGITGLRKGIDYLTGGPQVARAELGEVLHLENGPRVRIDEIE